MRGRLRKGLRLLGFFFCGQLDNRRIVVKLVKKHGTHLQFLHSALYSFSVCIHNCYMLVGVLVVVNARE
jgi:hypothetical protein